MCELYKLREKSIFILFLVLLQLNSPFPFISDNGPHYHNTAFLMYLAEVNAKFNLTLAEYNYFEAGEGKSALDTHFAHIGHKIVRWVRVGNNIETGNQLGELIEVTAIVYFALRHFK